MKRISVLPVVLVLVPLLVSVITDAGDGTGDKISVPERCYSALFIDLMDTAAQCQNVSIEGKNFVEGRKGEGTYTIPFDRIRQVEFRMQKNLLYGTVMLKDGSSLELILNKDKRAYVRTEDHSPVVRCC